MSFVTDVYSRRILAWKVATDKHAELVVAALIQAVSLRRRGNNNFSPAGVIHHSDAGSQYTSRDVALLLEEFDMTGSIGAVGDAYDNGVMESAIGLYKTELIDRDKDRRWCSWREVERETADWISWYSNRRLHSSICDVPPVEYEEDFAALNSDIVECAAGVSNGLCVSRPALTQGDQAQ